MKVNSVIIGDDLPILSINGESILPCGYMSYQIEKADYEAFINSGYKLIFVPIYAGDRGINPMSGIRPFYPGFWVGKDKYDFSCVYNILKKVIDKYKPEDIWIIPRVMVEVPKFWEDENESELCLDFSKKSVHQSYSSNVWFNDTKKALQALQDFFVESKYDEYIAGWQIACGWTEEFMRPTIYPMQFTDYSSTSLKAWRLFLEKTYKDISALNETWKTSYGSFDEIKVPSPAERSYVNKNDITYPISVVEYNKFRNVETATALITLAKYTKEIIGNNRIVGAFYGYAGTRFGHDAIDLILNCPYIDFLASPFSYDTQREPGTDWVLQGTLGSIRLHKKLWFIECDVRTHLSRPISISMPHANPIGNTMYDGDIWYGPKSEDMSIHQMKKVFAKTIQYQAGMWWFDMWGGWYKTEKYMDTIKKSIELYKSQTSEKSVSDIAIIYDTYAREKYIDNISLEKFLQILSKTGGAFEQFSLFDLGNIDVTKYKSIILLNVHEICPDINKWRKNNHSIIYVKSKSKKRSNENVYDCNGGKVYVNKEYQEYYFDDIPTSSELREAFILSGVHIYSFTDDVIYAYGKMVAIHASTDGEKRIFLPYKASLEDAFTKEKLIPCDYFTDFYMNKGETRVFIIT